MDRDPDNFTKLIDLSNRLEQASSPKNQLAYKYSTLMYHITRIMERMGFPREQDIPNGDVLNFGCGWNFIEGVNSDLVQIHRFFKGKRGPDIYLSGMHTPLALQQRFETVVCEHVLEHVLPSSGLIILQNLNNMLKLGGKIQVSVPSTVRYIDCSEGDITIDAIGLNENTYSYGHRFMYDPQTLSTLILNAGFRHVEVNSYETSPFKDLLVEKRSAVSIYLLGTK